MANQDIAETIASVGYAKVIVTLTPVGLGAGLAAAARGGVDSSASRDAEAQLQDHFIVPSEAQQESLIDSDLNLLLHFKAIRQAFNDCFQV